MNDSVNYFAKNNLKFISKIGEQMKETIDK